MSPARATLLHSPGHKPWGIIVNIFIEPRRGGTTLDKGKCSRRKCRSFGALIFCIHGYPGFHFGLCPHCTLGFEEVACLKALAIRLNFDALALALETINEYDVLTKMSTSYSFQ